MNLNQTIIAIVAIWGVGLSTYIAIRNFKKEKPKIKVGLSDGILVHGPQISPPMLLLEAANIGKCTVTLSSCGLKLPSKNMPFMVFVRPGCHQGLPYELIPGKNFLVWMEKSDIINELKSHNFKSSIKISGVYKDAVGNSYTSKSLNYKLNNNE